MGTNLNVTIALLVVILFIGFGISTLRNKNPPLIPEPDSLGSLNVDVVKEATIPDIPYIDPLPVNTGFLVKTPQIRADACAFLRTGDCRYPITLPFVEYNCKVTIPDNAPCNEFLQEP